MIQESPPEKDSLDHILPPQQDSLDHILESQDMSCPGDEETELYMNVSSSDVDETVLAEENFLNTMVGFLKDEIQEGGLLPCGVGRLFDNTSYDDSSLVTGHLTTASGSSDFDTLLSGR